jgi:hypothetical protein
LRWVRHDPPVIDWGTADDSRFWRYVAVGVALIGVGSVSNGYDYSSGDDDTNHRTSSD